MILTGQLILKTSSDIYSSCKDLLSLRYALLEDPRSAISSYCQSIKNPSSSLKSSCSVLLNTSLKEEDLCLKTLDSPETLKDLRSFKTSGRHWYLSSQCYFIKLPIFKISMKILR